MITQYYEYKIRHVSCCYYLTFIKTSGRITIRMKHNHGDVIRTMYRFVCVETQTVEVNCNIESTRNRNLHCKQIAMCSHT